MTTKSQDRTALVLGGSRGIGREIARTLAGRGDRVAVVARNKDDLATTLEELPADSGPHEAVEADLTEDGIESDVLESVREQLGSIDVAVHVIGGSIGIKDPMSSFEDWMEVLQFNLGIAHEFNRRLIPEMTERGWGRIVHLSSTASHDSGAPAPYASAKAALDAYVRNVGRTVADEGVIMSAVSPSVVVAEGNNWQKAMEDKPEWTRGFLSDNLAIGRSVAPEEIAEAVALLASEEASPFAGAIVPMDGGWL